MLQSLLPALVAMALALPAIANPPAAPGHADAGAGIVRFAEEGLRAHLQGRVKVAEIAPVGHSVARVCPGSHLVSRDVVSPALAPRMLATVRVRCDDGQVETIPVWFKVKAFAPVLVATREVAAGARLAPGDVQVAHADIAGVRGATVPASADPSGLHAVVPLKAGAAITLAAVRAEPEVVAQQPVLIRAGKGQVRIEVMGLALQNGRVGDRVQVVNLSSGDTLAARVTHVRAVEVLQ